MSEPKRYHLEMHKANDGDWVLYSDYASLKAEVERLTKAGDAMASGLQGMAGERPKALADEWNDAKGVNP